jgi:hypothetical protein
VVRKDDDERPVVEAARLQAIEEPSHQLVRPRDLPVVLPALVPRGVRLRRLVRRVRFVEVQEREGRLPAGIPLEPARQQLLRLGTGALDPAERLVRLGWLQRVFPELEPPADPALAREDDARDGPAGGIALLSEDLGEGRDVGAQVVAEVVAQAVHGRQLSGKEARVGGERQRDVAVRFLEEDGVLAKGGHVRRLDPAIAVHREVVGPEGVDRDDDNRCVREAEARNRVLAAPGFGEEEKDGSLEERPEAGRHGPKVVRGSPSPQEKTPGGRAARGKTLDSSRRA